MVKWCSAGTCRNHHMMKDAAGKAKYSFFKFPSYEKEGHRRALWARACRRVDPITKKEWQPADHIQYVYICSAHFISSQPSKEPGHPDYVPTKFSTGEMTSSKKRKQQSIRRFSTAMKRSGHKLLQQENTTRSKSRTLPHTSTKKVMNDFRTTESALGGQTRSILCDMSINTAESQLLSPEILSTSTEVSEAVNTTESQLASLEIPSASTEVSVAVQLSPKIPVAVTNYDYNGNTTKCTSPEKILPTKHQADRPLDQRVLFDEIDALRRERDKALAELDLSRARLNSIRLSATTVAGNDEKSQYYSGLTWAVFMATFHHLSKSLKTKGMPSVPLIDQFFYMLVKLKHNMKFEYLSDQTGIARTTLIDHFWKWLDLMYTRTNFLIKWPDREHIFSVIPPAFKTLYPRLTCIIDCFEVFIEAPGNLKARAQTWSNYKHHTTMKFLIGCSPLGAINFLSDAWGGRVSDVEIVTKSGFLTKCDHFPGDQVLADRGFTMKEQFAAMAGVELRVLGIFISFASSRREARD